MRHDTDDGQEYEYDGPSKSELKRQMGRLQVMGEKLMEMGESHWDKLPLTDNLRFALEESRRIRSHEGLRRHKQFIGKLMRDQDHEVIGEYLRKLEEHMELNTRAFHALENLRERLISGGNDAIGEVLSRHPDADSQKLRQLVRLARKERDTAEEKPSHEHSRKLFRFLRDLETGAPGLE